MRGLAPVGSHCGGLAAAGAGRRGRRSWPLRVVYVGVVMLRDLPIFREALPIELLEILAAGQRSSPVTVRLRARGQQRCRPGGAT